MENLVLGKNIQKVRNKRRCKADMLNTISSIKGTQINILKRSGTFGSTGSPRRFK